MDCRHHPTCPGCPLLPLPYPEQLAAKRARLAEALALYPHLPPAPEVRPAPRTEAYRHRLKLPIHVGRNRVAIGLYDRGGQRVLHTPDCPVLADPLRAALPPLLAQLTGRRGVHSLDLRVSGSSGELMAVLACAGGRLQGGEAAADAMIEATPGLVSVAVSTADPQGRRVMGRRPRVIAGAEGLPEAVGETEVQLYPGAFFQVDPEGARQLHGVVRALAGGARRILDLYSGVGAYALMLAPGRERVVAVEEVRQACQAARAAAPANVEVIEGRVEELDLESLGRFDLAILNPARRGSDPGVLLRLARLADRAIYVSCGPETFARDLDCLATHGLRVAALDALDLFPQTAEVEAVALLERGRPLARFPVTGGHARPPWGNREGISGAEGRPERVVALVIGDPGERGDLPGGRWRRLGLVAGHGLLRLELESGRLAPALAALARRGHPLAVRHEPTRRFFAEKGWLVRPFVHVERAGGARAPLHGDLVCALRALRADDRLVARAGGPS